MLTLDSIPNNNCVIITVNESGKIVIPIEYRKALGIKPGMDLILWVEDGVLLALTRKEIRRRVQEYFKQFKKDGESVVDELITERRAEAAKDF